MSLLPLLWALAGCSDAPVDTAADATPECAPLSVTLTQTWETEDLPLVGEPKGAHVGVALGDIDGDGWMDAFFAYPGGSMVLRNDGAGALQIDESIHMGAWPMPSAGAVALADLDGDGDLDAYLGRVREESDLILFNQGDGSFQFQHIEGSGGEATTGSFADADGDGDLDLFVATLIADIDLELVLTEEQQPDANGLYLQDDQGRFVAAHDRLPPEVIDTWAFQGSWLDHDDDGDMDLYLAHDFGPFFIPNRLLVNDGTGHFSAASDCFCELEMYGMGGAVGDADRDGRPDLYITDIGQTALLLNQGDGSFVEAALAMGASEPPGSPSLTSWATSFLDLDQDTWNDIATVFGVNQLPEEYEDTLDVDGEGWNNTDQQPDVLLLGGPDGFTHADEVGFTDPAKARGLAAGDLNNDGRPDLVTVGKNYLKVWMTEGGCDPGIQLTLAGPPGNAHAIGARVDVEVAGDSYTQWALPSTTGGNNAHVLYLGLGGRAQADRVTVTWPDGSTWSADDVAAGAHEASY